MEKLDFPKTAAPQTTLEEALHKRKSFFTIKEAPIPLEKWGALFGLALKKRDGKFRYYPSGGALYPVETYLFAEIPGYSAPAAFHYNPSAHTLEKLWDLPKDIRIKNLVPAHDIVTFSSLMVFTALWTRASAKYGDYTYNLSLLEAGHMSQNVLLAMTALGLKGRPMAAFDDDLVMNVLDLDIEKEQPIHGIVLSS